MGGGNRTSHGGQVLENIIQAMQLRDFAVISAEEFNRPCLEQQHQRLLVKNWPYTTIFGTQGRREYYIHSPEFRGQLECKFQSSSGSTDEKMILISETLRRTEETGMVLVYAGQWWKEARGKKIIDWMKREAKTFDGTGKQFLVLDIDNFICWVRRTFQ